MGATFDSSAITHARPYWLEKIPYTAYFPVIAAGAAIPVFAIRGWNTGGDTMYVALDALAISQVPGLQVAVTADKDTYRYYAGDFPPGLQMQRMGHGAVQFIGLTLVNTTTQPITGIQLMYRMLVWRAPIAFKVLMGYPLTAAEQQEARVAGISLSPNDDRGILPIRTEDVIDRTYANRRVLPWLGYAQSVAVSNANTPQTVTQFTATGNKLLVLTHIAATADIDDQIIISVDRDNDSAEIALMAEQLFDGADVFLPATDHLTIKTQSLAQVPPASTMPLRVEVLQLAMSTILRIRMGLIDQSGVADILQRQGLAPADAARRALQVIDNVLAGVN